MGKQVSNSPVIFTNRFYAFLSINVVVLYAILFKDVSWIFSFFTFFGINAFWYLASWGRYFNFEYDSKLLSITNSLNPFVSIEIDIKSVRKISMEFRNFAGFEVIITWNGETKGFIAGYIDKGDLQEMIDDINRMIKK
jgi:hypothetical protein